MITENKKFRMCFLVGDVEKAKMPGMDCVRVKIDLIGMANPILSETENQDLENFNTDYHRGSLLKGDRPIPMDIYVIDKSGNDFFETGRTYYMDFTKGEYRDLGKIDSKFLNIAAKMDSV